MARQSKVALATINFPGNHSIAFSSNSARDSWFDGRERVEFSDLSYVRPDRIQVQAKLDTIRGRNIGYYFNEIGIRIYFRVTGMEYLSENSTVIHIETDVLMTYLPSSTMQASFIERSNESPSSIFDSDVPEIQYRGGFSHTLLGTFGTPQEYGYFAQAAGDWEPGTQSLYHTEYEPKSFNDSNASIISFMSMFKFFDNESDFQVFIQQYATAGTGDRLVSAGAFPKADLTYSEINSSTSHVALIGSVRNTTTISVETGLNTRIAKDNVTVVIAEVDNFANQIEVPITELSGGSLQLVYVTDPISQQRHYAVLSGADGDNELKYRITINTGASLPTVNLPYYMAVRNIETDLSAQQANLLIGSAQSIGSAALTGAGAGAFVGGPVGALAGGLIGGTGAALATATSGIQNIVSAGAALEKAKTLSPTVSGNPTGFGVFANRNVGVNIFLKEPNGSGLQQLTDYYRFFGYNKSRILTPQVKSGTKFYVGNVNGLFPGASASEIAIIRSLFASGVWIWANEGSVFNY